MFLPRSNQALQINPPAGQQHLSAQGSDWLWAVTAIFVLEFLVFFGATFVARSGEKIFHYLFTVALLVGSIAYYAMASDLAWDVIAQVDQPQNGITRQIFFAKYVYWAMSFPTVTIALGLISGISWATIFYNVVLSWTWVLTYLFTAYTHTTYKWGFYAFGTAAYLLLAHNTLLESRRTLSARPDSATGPGVGRARADHALLSGWANLVWLNYPVALAISDSGNVIGVTGGLVYSGILDLLLVPVLAVVVVVLARRWDYGRMNIAFTQYGRVRARGGEFPAGKEQLGGAGEDTAGGPAGRTAGAA